MSLPLGGSGFVVLACVIVALGGWVRWLFIRQSSSLKVDHHYWVLAAEAFRRRQGLPVRLDGRYLMEPPEQAYPPGFGWLLSKLPPAFLNSSASVWLCQAADAMALALGLAFAAWLGLDGPGLLAVLLTALFAPTLVAYNTQLNPRSFGNLFLVIKCASEVLAVSANGSESVLPWSVAALATAAIWLTHKMTAQLMLFLWLPWAAALASPVAALMPLLGLAVAAVIVGPGPMLYQCAAHLDIVRFWSRHWQFLGVHGIRRSPIYGSTEADTGDAFHRGGWRGQVQHLRLIFGYAPALVLMPATVLLAAPMPPAWLAVWTVGTLAWALLTAMVGPLKGLGAGPLYVFFAVIPAAIWLGLGVESGHWAALLAFAASTGLSALALMQGWRQRQSRRVVTEDGQAHLVGRLRSGPRERVAVFPLTATEAVAGETQHAILWGAHGYGFDLLEPIFPRVTRPLAETFSRYGIERVVWNDTWWPQAEAALKKEMRLGEVESFGAWRTASVAGLPPPPKPRVGVLAPVGRGEAAAERGNCSDGAVLAEEVPIPGSGRLGVGRLDRHLRLYRHLRTARYDIVDGRQVGMGPLVIATIAGVPHRIGRAPRTRMEAHLVRSGIWRAPAATAVAMEPLAGLEAVYLALFRGDYAALAVGPSST